MADKAKPKPEPVDPVFLRLTAAADHILDGSAHASPAVFARYNAQEWHEAIKFLERLGVKARKATA